MTTFHSMNPVVSDIDPALFGVQEAVNAMLATMPHPDVRTEEGLAALRTLTTPPQASPQLVPENLTIDGPGGVIRLRIFTPGPAARAVFLRIHGGGWAAGSPEDDDALNDEIARRCNVIVISPEYRLVPESSFIDQIDDCVATARWIGRESVARFGTDRVLIGGISAGAYLAATTLLRLRDAVEPVFDHIVGAHLDCGAYDLSGTPSVRAADDSTLILTHDWIYGLIEIGLPGLDEEARRSPIYSPLYADPSNLPPVLFTVGTLDPLLDDSLFLAARWQLAGGTVDLDVWPEAAHAFTNMGTPLSTLGTDRTTSWIDEILTRGQAK
jgi:acetyl esterase